MPRWASSRSQRAGRREEATGRSGRMAEGIMERAVREALAAAGLPAALLVLAHDVTEREETRRRLEAENLRLALFASVARRVASIDPTRVVEAAVGAACTIANGPTAIYLVGHEGEITRTATAGTSATI